MSSLTTKEKVEARRRWWKNKLDGACVPLAEETAFWRSEIEICDMALRSLESASATEAVAWLIEFNGGEKRVWRHNCIAEYRDNYSDATSTPLYAATQKSG